jgi:hypothetical protein
MIPMIPIVGGAAAAGLIGTLAGGGKTASDYGGGPSLVTNPAPSGSSYPYSSSPGLQPGNAANGVQGVSFAQPGRLESSVDQGVNLTPNTTNQTWNWFAPSMSNPGTGEKYSQYATRLPNQAGAGPNNVNTQEAYDWFGQNQPNLEANMGPYYENAKRRALESVNANAAARGGYGSSAAMDMGNEAITNLEAQRAKDEAEYGLQRANVMQGWGSAAAGAANAADQARLAGLGESRLWTTGMGNLALAGDQERRARELGAIGAAGTIDEQNMAAQLAQYGLLGAADTAAQQRGMNAYNMAMGLGTAANQTMGDAYQQELAYDQQLQNAYMAMALGMPTEALNASKEEAQNLRSDVNQGMDIMSWAKDMGYG